MVALSSHLLQALNLVRTCEANVRNGSVRQDAGEKARMDYGFPSPERDGGSDRRKRGMREGGREGGRGEERKAQKAVRTMKRRVNQNGFCSAVGLDLNDC